MGLGQHHPERAVDRNGGRQIWAGKATGRSIGYKGIAVLLALSISGCGKPFSIKTRLAATGLRKDDRTVVFVRKYSDEGSDAAKHRKRIQNCLARTLGDALEGHEILTIDQLPVGPGMVDESIRYVIVVDGSTSESRGDTDFDMDVARDEGFQVVMASQWDRRTHLVAQIYDVVNQRGVGEVKAWQEGKEGMGCACLGTLTPIPCVLPVPVGYSSPTEKGSCSRLGRDLAAFLSE